MPTTSSNQPPKAFVFDAYGTLFDVHSVVGLCHEFFPNQGPGLSQVWRAKQLEYTWLLSLMESYEDFWHVTEKALKFACDALRLACTPAQQARLMEAYLYLEPYPEVHSALAGLAHYPRAILSNGSPRMLQAVVSRAGLQAHFTHLISIEEVKIYKPSPRVYQLACDKVGVAAGQIAFVSSNPFDVMGAASFGFQTFWVNRTGQVFDALGPVPAYTISQLTELAVS